MLYCCYIGSTLGVKALSGRVSVPLVVGTKLVKFIYHLYLSFWWWYFDKTDKPKVRTLYGIQPPDDRMEGPSDQSTDAAPVDTSPLGTFLKRHFHSLEPVVILKYDVSSAVPEGENYSSLVYRVKMLTLLSTGRKKTLSVIVKTEHTGPRKLGKLQVFKGEIHVFVTVLPMMESIMDEFDDRRSVLWPHFYGYEPYTSIAVEDLTSRNFKVAQRRDCLSIKHARLVLRNIARFQAMGKILISRGLISENDFEAALIVRTHDSMKKMWYHTITALANAIEDEWGPEWASTARRIRNLNEMMSEKLIALSAERDKRFQVLNHGDVWICNVMFRNSEYENEPIDVKFIDYQGVTVNSFIWDVQYFIATSVAPTVFAQERQSLYQIYHEALLKNLNFFNYDGYIPTMEDVKAEVKRTEFLRFAAMTMQPVMTADSTRPLDLEKLMTHPTDEVISKSAFRNGTLKSRLANELKYFEDAGVI